MRGGGKLFGLISGLFFLFSLGCDTMGVQTRDFHPKHKKAKDVQGYFLSAGKEFVEDDPLYPLELYGETNLLIGGGYDTHRIGDDTYETGIFPIAPEAEIGLRHDPGWEDSIVWGIGANYGLFYLNHYKQIKGSCDEDLGGEFIHAFGIGPSIGYRFNRETKLELDYKMGFNNKNPNTVGFSITGEF